VNSIDTAQFHERKYCLACASTRLKSVATGFFDKGKVAQYISEDPWGENPAPFLVGQPWELVQCTDCALRFHRYILTPEWNERRFSQWMTKEAIKAFEETQRSDPPFRRASYFAEHVLRLEYLLQQSHAGNARLRVLDFGSGDGEFLTVCGAFGFDAHGVDRSSARRSNSTHVMVHEEISDAKAFAPFHAITLFEVLEHLDDPKTILEQLHGLLHENGILVLETPNCERVDDIDSRAAYYAIHPLEHINAFDPDTLRRFAENLGFRSIEKPVAFVTMDTRLVLRNLAKKPLKALTRSGTRQYFRKS
jgi:2-polyprenyl-3-methyl-5-hydroxy-6-metoxy-1,4-benzoquinol methylase